MKSYSLTCISNYVNILEFVEAISSSADKICFNYEL